MKKSTTFLVGILCGVLLMFSVVVTAAFISGSQDRQYVLKGTPEQMVALRIAVEQSSAPYRDVIKVQEWLIPQLIQQDQAFAKVDSINKAKTK